MAVSAGETALRAESLTKRYGSLTAVDGLTLAVGRGEILGLLGPNGAGKTTAINMMVGLLRPDAGQAYIYGQPVHGGDRRAAARAGVCPQQIVLWPKLTCMEQLEFMGEMYGLARAAARARGVGLLLAMGLDEKRDQLARALSGGMQRRLNLAMALVHDPDVLVLDEPEAGLDPQSRVLVRDYVKSLAREQGKAIILSTHNMDEADRMAGRVAIIDQGKLLTDDTPANLKRRLGEGDVLEISVEVEAGDARAVVGAAWASVPPEKLPPEAKVEVAVGGDAVVVRGRGLIEFLPAILDALREAGMRTSDVRLRENTLEDVFIALTGRRLRE